MNNARYSRAARHTLCIAFRAIAMVFQRLLGPGIIYNKDA